MRVLLTGAGGQLGWDLREALNAHELHAFDHQGLDVADREAVLAAAGRIKPEWIINAAAYNEVDGAEEEEARAFAVNGAGPGYLAEAAAQVKARLLQVSTDYVFDGRKGEAYTEDDVPHPLSVYGRSKLEGERRVLASGVPACILRTAWLYGRHGKNFVKAILAAVPRGRPLRVVADQVGSPTATADLAGTIGALIETRVEGLFHVVNAGACSRYEFARAIVQGSVEVVPISSAEAGRRASRPANSSLRSVRWVGTGLASLRPWESALSAFLDTVGDISTLRET
jgi:dTDP-4-dehydrorhamnose reductase